MTRSGRLGGNMKLGNHGNYHMMLEVLRNYGQNKTTSSLNYWDAFDFKKGTCRYDATNEHERTPPSRDGRD